MEKPRDYEAEGDGDDWKERYSAQSGHGCGVYLPLRRHVEQPPLVRNDKNVRDKEHGQDYGTCESSCEEKEVEVSHKNVRKCRNKDITLAPWTSGKQLMLKRIKELLGRLSLFMRQLWCVPSLR